MTKAQDPPASSPTPDDAPAEPSAASSPKPAGRLLALGNWTLFLLGVGVIAVVLAFLAWRGADHDPDLARAQLRDQAIIEGSSAVETMNSMDYRDIPGGLKAWRSVTTGVLHDQLVAAGDDDQELLAEQGKISVGRVVEAALTQLSERTATMIVAVEVTVADKDPSQDPAVKRNRYSADLVLVGGVWKIENLGQVPVGVS